MLLHPSVILPKKGEMGVTDNGDGTAMLDARCLEAG